MTATQENGWALSITAFIAAPPEKVWEIMTNRMEEYWCPKPWRTEIIEQQWYAGGRSAMVMKGPEGKEHRLEGIFLEVIPGVRFVTTDAVVRGDDGSLMPAAPFMLGIWEIAPEGDGTRYTARSLHWNEATAKQHDEMGFQQGWGTCAEQLKELAEG